MALIPEEYDGFAVGCHPLAGINPGRRAAAARRLDGSIGRSVRRAWGVLQSPVCAATGVCLSGRTSETRFTLQAGRGYPYAARGSSAVVARSTDCRRMARQQSAITEIVSSSAANGWMPVAWTGRAIQPGNHITI